MSASILQIHLTTSSQHFVTKLHLTMSEQQFVTLLSAVEYAWGQIATDMEIDLDLENDQEFKQLSYLLEQLWDARRTAITEGANV